MDSAEEKALDLPARMANADAFDARLRPLLQGSPTYGGAYFDQAAGGKLTILLTANDGATVDMIARALPASQSWEVRQATHPEAELMSAVATAQRAWDQLNSSVVPLGFGVDVRRNGVFVEVVEQDFAAANLAAASLSKALGVPVATRVGVPGHDTHCTTSRDHCDSPMKAGINIYRGANFTTWYCTQGFHISIGTDEQFVTSGHCGYFTPNTWFHPAFSTAIGSEQGTLYVNGGQDIMHVSMLDVQASDDVYNDGNDIIGMGTPTTGETLCASLGAGSNAVKCGTVQDDWRSWTSETAGFTVWGGDMSYTTIKGDSGSPVYRRLPGGGGEQRRAIGANSHENGYFARLDVSLDDFGAVVFQ